MSNLDKIKEEINKLIIRETQFIQQASNDKSDAGIGKHKFHTAKKGMALEILRIIESAE